MCHAPRTEYTREKVIRTKFSLIRQSEQENTKVSNS
jgi:hypothetical protein